MTMTELTLSNNTERVGVTGYLTVFVFYLCVFRERVSRKVGELERVWGLNFNLFLSFTYSYTVPDMCRFKK
jgi:hypothetical protein